MTSQSGSDASTRLRPENAPPLAPSIRRTLGQHLRDAYASLDDDPPDRFAVLLARLEAVLAALADHGFTTRIAPSPRRPAP